MNSTNPYICITGASRGIGRAIAIEFAKNGKDLVLVSSKSQRDLEAVQSEVTAYGVNCLTYTTDVSDYKSVCDLKTALQAKSIRIDCVINNAGISYFGLIQDMSPEDFNQVIQTNLSSVFYTTKLFVEDMIQNQKGCIINISSVWGNVGASCEAAYSASKGGVNAFTKALAKELAPSGIAVNAIACGAIDTSMNNRLSNEEKDALKNEIPIGRMGTPSEIAELAYKLYSMNPYLTGQILTIDGGWT